MIVFFGEVHDYYHYDGFLNLEMVTFFVQPPLHLAAYHDHAHDHEDKYGEE